MEDTLILFGRSPFINTIRDKIPYLISKYHTMGVNYFCNSFPDVEYVIFYDNIVPDVKKSTIITSFKNLEKDAANLIYSHKYELYNVKRNNKEFSKDKSTLHFWIHTPSMALNWAYQKGFRNVVLAGIDLNHGRFDSFPSREFSDTALKEARNHLTKIATQYLNIYQLNPDSDLDLPKIQEL